jgi:hypothetical protein
MKAWHRKVVSHKDTNNGLMLTLDCGHTIRRSSSDRVPSFVQKCGDCIEAYIKERSCDPMEAE